MNKLTQLLSKCKCSVYLHLNAHRNKYETVDESFKAMQAAQEIGLEDLSLEVKQKMIELDTIVDLHFCPDSPVGHYRILHYDLELALDAALKCFDGDRD